MILPKLVIDLVKQARRVVACIDFDDQGVMVGHARQGGNGGLLSIDSIAAAEELRRLLAELDEAPTPSAAPSAPQPVGGPVQTEPAVGTGDPPRSRSPSGRSGASGEDAPAALTYAPGPVTLAHYRQRFERMLVDLDVDVAALIAGAGWSVRDDAHDRDLVASLRNQTLCEGLISAIKLAAAGLQEKQP